MLTNYYAIKVAAEKLNLKIVKELKPSVFLCDDTECRRVVLKSTNEVEILIYGEVLRTLLAKYGDRFKKLTLPDYVRADESRKWILLPYYSGESYEQKWDETDIERGFGLGVRMKTELAKDMAQALDDLSLIDIESLRNNSVLQKIPKFEFDFEVWWNGFRERGEEMARRLLITDAQLVRAMEVMESGFSHSEKIFNCGEFYPRNIVKTGKKIVLLDWQGWTDHQVNYIDYVENVIAFALVHMAGNTAWQRIFLKESRRRFRIKEEDLQKAILIKSFDLAYRKRYNLTFAKYQMEIFRSALNDDYAGHLMREAGPSVPLHWVKKVIGRKIAKMRSHIDIDESD